MPTTDEAADFAREITHVHRLTVDRLNRKQLLRYAKSRGVDQESKTLANWSDMMQSEFAMPEAEVSLILKPFRVIRDVRNAAAHSSAAELKGILKVAGLDPRRPREAFTHLVCTIATYAWRLRGEVIRKKRGHDKALPRRRAFFSPDRR